MSCQRQATAELGTGSKKFHNQSYAFLSKPVHFFKAVHLYTTSDISSYIENVFLCTSNHVGLYFIYNVLSFNLYLLISL